MIDPQRYPRLSRIQVPADLRQFPEEELRDIADELRAYLIEQVAMVGGHFGAGLGVIELTVALHWLYDTPVDRLVWDVGHQCYPHKILTGRRDTIHTVKQKDGVAPFPKREESEYDTFGVGHSSTSISAALGMAVALQRAGDDRKVVAVIGDGAMTAGMAFEALMHAGGMGPEHGSQEPNLLVILNDNQMSISENVGGLTKMLGRLTGSRTLNAIREGGKKLLGDKHKPAAKFVKRWEEHWKGMFVPSTLFEEMGFHYTGPLDGHDVGALLAALKTLKTLKGPQLLHIITTKGKGYELAEDDQIGYHAVGPFDPVQGPGRQTRREEADLHRRLRRLALRHGRRRPEAVGHYPGDARRLGIGAFQQGISRALFRRRHRRAARGDARRRHGVRRRQAGGRDLLDLPAARLRPAGA